MRALAEARARLPDATPDEVVQLRAEDGLSTVGKWPFLYAFAFGIVLVRLVQKDEVVAEDGLLSDEVAVAALLGQNHLQFLARDAHRLEHAADRAHRHVESGRLHELSRRARAARCRGASPCLQPSKPAPDRAERPTGARPRSHRA